MWWGRILGRCFWLMQRASRVAFFLLRCLARRLLRHLTGSPTTFGSARFATRRDLRRSGHLKGSGLILAKFGNKLLRYNQPEGSVIVFAPQGRARASASSSRTCWITGAASSAPTPRAKTTPSPPAAVANSDRSGGSTLPTPLPPTASTRSTLLFRAHRPRSMTPRCSRT